MFYPIEELLRRSATQGPSAQRGIDILREARLRHALDLFFARRRAVGERATFRRLRTRRSLFAASACSSAMALI